MKRILLLTAMALFLAPAVTLAQDKLEKPKDIKVEEFDAFKNKAFSIYNKSGEFKTMVENGDKFKLKDVEDVNKLQEDIRKMQEKSQDLVDRAKKMKPPTKAPKAVKNTNTSIKALKASADNLTYVAQNMVKEEE